MAFTFDELKHKTVGQLREIAKEMDHEAVKGYTQLNKEHLLAAICKAINLDMHIHHDVVGLDKTKIKKQIKELKIKRDKALEEKDKKSLIDARAQIHKLKRKLRSATV